MAAANPSVESKFFGISLNFKILCNILATCSLDALPFPVIAIFIFFGEYSVIGISFTKPAAIATPCALPNLSID